MYTCIKSNTAVLLISASWTVLHTIAVSTSRQTGAIRAQEAITLFFT